MKLMFDIPKEFNDMNRSEISQLYMKLKSLVDQLERALGNLTHDNLNPKFRKKVEDSIKSAEEYKKEAEGRSERVFSVSLPYTDRESRTVESDLITEKSIISIQPTVDADGNMLGVRNVQDGKFEVYGGFDPLNITVIIHEEAIP